MKTKGVKEFAKSASAGYKSIAASDKAELQRKCEESKALMAKDIKHEGQRIFKNMDKQVYKLSSPKCFGIYKFPLC